MRADIQIVPYEDAPKEVRQELSGFIDQQVQVTLTATVKSVGSKAVQLEVETLYGEYTSISVPIANLIDIDTASGG